MASKGAFSLFMIRNRYPVLIIALICVAAFSYGATKINSEVILKDLFPYDHPYLKLNERFVKIFGGGGFGAIIAVKNNKRDIFNEKTMTVIKAISDDLQFMPEVYRSMTRSMATSKTKVVKMLAKGEIMIVRLMDKVPETEEEMSELRTNLFSRPDYNGTLVSEDGTAALIFTQVKDFISYASAFDAIHGLVTKYSDDEISIHCIGYPILMGWIYSHKAQMYIVFGISIVLMLFVLYVLFRNLTGMIAPMLMAFICTGLGLGFIGWTGINFSPLLYVLGFLVGARVISNAVQITHRYVQEYKVHALNENLEPRRYAAIKTMQTMMRPNVVAVATDACGFTILGLAKIVLMQQLAILMSFWMLTIALCGVLVPVICACSPRLGGVPTKKEEGSEEGTVESLGGEGLGWMNKSIVAMTKFSVGSGRYVVISAIVLILGIGLWQTTKLKIGDPTPGSPVLWPDAPYNIDTGVINNNFIASSETFMLYYEGKEGSVYDTIVLKTFEKFDRYMKDTLPDIYKGSRSIINPAKNMNLTLHDGDQIWYSMPRDEEDLSGLMGYLRISFGIATLASYIEATLERTHLTIYFADHTSDNLLRIKKAAYDFFDVAGNPWKTENGEFLLAGGSVGMEIGLNEEMTRTHALMDGMVLCAIFLMCTFAFRSIVAGLMLTLPLLLSNLVAFAYMAMTGIGLSTNTLPCSAIGVGVGVDFAIYLYSRCVEEYPNSKGWVDTVLTGVRTAGLGIVFTGITLIFPILTWYFISSLKFQAQIGFFLSLLLFVNMIGALTLHPLMITLVKPKFMTRGLKDASKGSE